MMQPIRMRTAIEMRLFTSGKASSSSPVLVLKVPNLGCDTTSRPYGIGKAASLKKIWLLSLLPKSSEGIRHPGINSS